MIKNFGEIQFEEGYGIIKEKARELIYEDNAEA